MLDNILKIKENMLLLYYNYICNLVLMVSAVLVCVLDE